MGLASWFYTNSTKQQVVKIVHPGGHAELHDTPVLASEIIQRNPRCCVAHPTVFQQPWAIVSPETTLMPGQKFYVVPITTVRRLQKLSLKHYPSLQPPPPTSNRRNAKGGESEGDRSSNTAGAITTPNTCWLLKETKNRGNRNDASSNDSFCKCLLKAKVKANNNADSKELNRLTTNFKSTDITTDAPNRDNNDTGIEANSHKGLIPLDQWQPGLESVCEEYIV